MIILNDWKSKQMIQIYDGVGVGVDVTVDWRNGALFFCKTSGEENRKEE